MNKPRVGPTSINTHKQTGHSCDHCSWTRPLRRSPQWQSPTAVVTAVGRTPLLANRCLQTGLFANGCLQTLFVNGCLQTAVCLLTLGVHAATTLFANTSVCKQLFANTSLFANLGSARSHDSVCKHLCLQTAVCKQLFANS